MTARYGAKVALLGAIVSTSAIAQQRVDELFGDGVFGVAWGDTIEKVAAAHPGGERRIEGQKTATYTVRDGRTIFQIARNPDNELVFGFTDGALDSVVVDFPNCSDLMASLFQQVGPMGVSGSNTDDVEGRLGMINLGVWGGNRAGISVTMIDLDCTLAIAAKLDTALRSRQDLGLN